MRLGRICAGLALLMLGSVAVGCGDGQPPPQAQGEVAGPVTKPRVAAFAREVQLRAGDLPGATVLPAGLGGGKEVGQQFSECTGSSLEVPTVAKVASPAFLFGEGDERAVFASEIAAVPTPYEAKTGMTLLASRRAFHCLRQYVRNSFRTSAEGKARNLSISRLSTPLPPTRASFGIRIGATLVEGDKETPVFVDNIDFASGPTDISLTAIGSPTPVNQLVEAGLMDALYFRAVRFGF